jgi:hypothetical protein
MNFKEMTMEELFKMKEQTNSEIQELMSQMVLRKEIVEKLKVLRDIEKEITEKNNGEN